MSKLTLIAAAGIASMAWITPAVTLYFSPPELVHVARLEVTTSGDLVMDREVNPRASEAGEQAILSITIEGPGDDFVCSGQRLINLRKEESPVKHWRINDWFSVPCPLSLPIGAIVHGTWVPVDRDRWSITSARYVIPPADFGL